jgi:hypothetical protein
MKGLFLFLLVLSISLLSGCAEGFWRHNASDQSRATVVFYPTDANTILSCMTERRKMTHKEFGRAFRAASKQAAKGERAASLRLICLSLHDYASYKQFKSGMKALAAYIKDYPDDAASLQGIYQLLQRVDKEKINKWNQGSKSSDEKEELESENTELQERNEILEQNADQDQVRIQELQKQIEQLKNIENIIKNRER